MTPMMSSSLLTTPLASCRVYARFLRSLYIWSCTTQAVANLVLFYYKDDSNSNNNDNNDSNDEVTFQLIMS